MFLITYKKLHTLHCLFSISPYIHPPLPLW
nr:MAG TPA: hypothetical protein [Caudoviricetes sp.]